MAPCLGGVPRDAPGPSPTTCNTAHTSNSSKSLTSSNSPKRKPTSDPSYFPYPSILSSSLRATASPPSKRSCPQKDNSYMELHQSTCLNINGSDNSDSDLWILPDFEDWEINDASPLTHPASANPDLSRKKSQSRQSLDTAMIAGQNQWTPLVQRAASSNRERLRRRLEGDGWDFVGGKYGYGAGSELWMVTGAGSEESVDEEFDVVVLPPRIAVS